MLEIVCIEIGISPAMTVHVWFCWLWCAVVVVLRYWVGDDGGKKGDVNVCGPASANGAVNARA